MPGSIRRGRLTVRERIERITDTGSFREVGTLAGTGEYDEALKLKKVTPATYVAGTARIDGRPVAIGGEDFTVRGGTSFGAQRRKGGQGGYIEDLAHHYKMPLINLIDGAGGTVTSAKRRGFVVFPASTVLSAPSNFSAKCRSLPPCSAPLQAVRRGAPSSRISRSWFRAAVRYFAAGPPVVKRSLGQTITKEELGRSGGRRQQGGLDPQCGGKRR